MPFTARIIQPQIPSLSGGGTDSVQNATLGLLKCLMDLSRHTASIHSQLESQFTRINSRMQSLTRRLSMLQQNTSHLPIAAADIQVRESSFDRYTCLSSDSHFTSDNRDCKLEDWSLQPYGRPPHVTALYDSLTPNIHTLAVESATQTDIEDKCQVATGWAGQILPLKLTTPKPRSRIRPPTVSRNNSRRNTVAIDHSDIIISVATKLEDDTYDNIGGTMSECPYQILPLQKDKRRSKAWFSSLRRPKKRVQEPLVHHIDTIATSNWQSLPRLRRSLRRCMSMSGPGVPNIPISTQSPVVQLATVLRGEQGENHDPRHSASSGYSSHQNRPVSIASLGSINSLHNALKDSSATYRVGYKVDLPEVIKDDQASLSSIDPEGYYTSMRRHSGIVGRETTLDHYPPLVEVVLSDDSADSSLHKTPTKIIHRPKVIQKACMSPVVHANFVSPSKTRNDLPNLDTLLLARFEAELRSKQIDVLEPRFSSASLPRKAVTFCN